VLSDSPFHADAGVARVLSGREPIASKGGELVDPERSAAVQSQSARSVRRQLVPVVQGRRRRIHDQIGQGKRVFNYALAFLEASPVLRQEIASVTRSEIRLRNGVVIAVHANSYRTVRGSTLLACVCDVNSIKAHNHRCYARALR
jgi:hypothetical protein